MKIFIIFAIFITCISCNKENAIEYNVKSSLSFKINGISEVKDSEIDINQLASTKIINTDPVNASKTQKFDGFEISSEVIVDKLNPTSSKVKSINKKASTLPLSSTSKYWLILYKANDRLIIYNQQVSASAPLNIPDIDVNHNYKWVAITYNDSDNIIGILQNQTHIPANYIWNLEGATNKPLMYASGDILSSQLKDQESYTVPITFEQKTALIRFLLDVSEFEPRAEILTSSTYLYAPRASTGLSESKLYRGTINLINGQYTSYNNLVFFNNQYYYNKIDFSSPQLISTTTASAYSKNYYNAKEYLTSAPLTDFAINVNEITWKNPNAPDGQTVDNTKIPGDPNRIIKYNIDNLRHGYIYTIKIKIKKGNSITFNNLIWAENNLTYNHTTKVYAFKNDEKIPSGMLRKRVATNGNMNDWMHGEYDQNPRPTYQIVQNETDYFKAGRLKSFTPSSDEAYDASNDPCTKHPDGNWRLPTEQEFVNLYANNSTRFKRIGYYYDMFMSTSSDGIAGKQLKFYPYGSIEYVGSQEHYNSSDGTYYFSGTNNYYPYELGYDQDETIMVRTYSNGYDLGQGAYLVKSGTGFKYFITNQYPIGNNKIANIRDIGTSAFSVRCVKNIQTTNP